MDAFAHPDWALPDWPTFGLTDDVRPALRQAMQAGHASALVTLIEARNGAPRPVGAQMLVAENGEVSGFLSGGCVEGDVILHARQCLAEGAPARLVYGEGSPWPDIRLLCGARIELLVERVGPDDPAAADLLARTEARQPAIWLTDGRTRACLGDGEARPFAGLIARRYEPSPRLAVVGSDPTALAIAAQGATLGYETHLLRPLGPETPPPLPGVGYHRGALADGFAAVGLDAGTHVAVATHDLELDEAALAFALPSPAPYVGVLGARRRLDERKERLLARGVAPSDLARLHGPIGLKLGGKAPFEIAVAVLAEITQARHAAAAPLLQRLDEGESAAA